MKFRFTVVIGFILSLTSIGLLLAQGSCPAIVEQALLSMGDNCDELGRNSVCYGYNLVTAEFTEAVGDDFFISPSDVAALGMIETIRTSEMNTTSSQWGVAVMSLQANVPNSIPGQSVKFVLLGDVEVESAVEPESTFQAVDAITVTMISGSNIRSGPGLNNNVIGGVEAGETLPVDGQSADGAWYRTIIGSRIGWVFGELIGADESLASLPTIDGTQRSLMQSFFLRTGFGTPACEEAPEDTLMIQGPEGIEIDLTINGADIRLGSTITVRILPPGNVMEIAVIDGKVVVPGAGPDGTDLIINENERSTACLTEPDSRGVDGSDNDRVVGCGENSWTEPESVPESALGASFCVFEDVPETLLNYKIDLNCPSSDEPIQIIINEGSSGNSSSASATEEPTEEPSEDNNLCSEGNAWDDGRCTSDYWWEAGFYYGKYEAGEITLEQIPDSYKSSPTATPTAEPTKEKKKSKYCQIDYGEGFDIFEKSTGEYVESVDENPGYPECDQYEE